MEPGIVEIISLLLGLTGFGAEANPRAPTADASLQYAIPDADFVVTFDGAVVLPKNHRALSTLADQPAIKASPELVKAIRDVTSQVEGARGMVKGMIGLDVVTDVYDGTMFVRVPAQGDATFVAAVHGKFTPAMFDRIAGMTGKPAQKIGGGVMVETGANDPAVGLTKDGVLIAGTPALVKARLDNWQIPARPAGSAVAVAAEVLAGKPIFSVSVALTAGARKRVQQEQGPSKNFGTDLLDRHKTASMAVYADGIGWTWTDKTRAGMESMALMSEGMMEIMRAAQIAPRGAAKIAIAGLDAYKSNKQVAAMLKRKGDLLKLIDAYTGDGNFKIDILKNPKSNGVTARATGKRLSEVVPLASMLPVGALVFLSRSSSSPPPPPSPPPPMMTPAPGGVKTPARPPTKKQP